MKIAHTDPAKGELYAIERRSAVHLIRSICPELPLLAFQTMHVPKMDPEIPYLATFSSNYIRLLSVRAEFMNEQLKNLFSEKVFPHICNTFKEWRRQSYSWPAVIVAYQGLISVVTCSAGALFPNRDEIIRSQKKHRHVVCPYQMLPTANKSVDATARSPVVSSESTPPTHHL